MFLQELFPEIADRWLSSASKPEDFKYPVDILFANAYKAMCSFQLRS